MYQENYYKILQVDPAAEPEVIAAAYRRLAQKYHPDARRDRAAALRMRELNTAYEVLSNPDKRAQYDQSRSSASKGGDGGSKIIPQPAAPESRVVARPARQWRTIIAIAVGSIALLTIGASALLWPSISTARQETTSRIWDGECRDPEGYVYTCRVRIKINRANRVTGSVLWTLKTSPRASEKLAVGRQARAYVKGTFDPSSRQITMGSHTQDDPYDIINANEYSLWLAPNEQTLSGATFDDGIRHGSLAATLKD